MYLFFKEPRWRLVRPQLSTTEHTEVGEDGGWADKVTCGVASWKSTEKSKGTTWDWKCACARCTWTIVLRHCILAFKWRTPSERLKPQMVLEPNKKSWNLWQSPYSHMLKLLDHLWQERGQERVQKYLILHIFNSAR